MCVLNNLHSQALWSGVGRISSKGNTDSVHWQLGERCYSFRTSQALWAIWGDHCKLGFLSYGVFLCNSILHL